MCARTARRGEERTTRRGEDGEERTARRGAAVVQEKLRGQSSAAPLRDRVSCESERLVEPRLEEPPGVSCE
jgi:hypothetical protein